MAESERRQVTVLFADISGFTSLSEKTDPENVTSLMNECFGFLGKIIEEHGGIIDKYIGDRVMALFGAPRAMENAARARCWMLEGSMQECERELEKARACIRRHRFVPAMYGTFYRVVRLAYEVSRFEEAVSHGSLRQRIKSGRAVCRAGRAAISCSQKNGFRTASRSTDWWEPGTGWLAGRARQPGTGRKA